VAYNQKRGWQAVLRAQAREGIMMSCGLRIGACLLWSSILPLFGVPLARPYAVENYDVSIRLDLASQRLDGEVKIRIHSRADEAISVLELDAGTLQIEGVEEGQERQLFERAGSRLLVALTNPLYPGQHRTVTVRYQAGASPGLKFYNDQVYGSVTSDWMPCNDRPEERATLHVAIVAPQSSTSAASGELTGSRTENGERTTDWQLDSAAAPSWFGFAVGNFAENASEADGVKLRVLGAGSDVLESTAASLRFLAKRSGKRYPGERYTEVFLHGDTVRAVFARLALLPEAYGKASGNKQDLLWLLTSELAQQWYGIEIAPKDWSDLWLSKGVSAFLADEFLGQRFGEESYERQIEQSRQNYNVLRAEGKDRPLSNSDWRTRQDLDEEVPVHKGICFLYSLNDLVGANAFSDGLRLYTDGHWGQTASSEDFQNAFRWVYSADGSKTKKTVKPYKGKGEGKRDPPETPLDRLFDLWVYGFASGNSN
jgi:aminopeptidase N